MALFGGLFGERFKENWNGTADQAGLRDKLGVIGVGLSQLSAGQAPNILPAWQAVEDRRAKRKLGEAMANPELLAGFTPEQQKMLSVMPPELAQSLIMEKMFAPPVAPEYREFNGDLYDMSGGTPSVVLDGMSGAEVEAQKAAAERAKREQDAAFLGYAPGSPEFNQYVVTGEMPKPVTPTDDMREYEMAKSQGYTGTFQQYQVDLKKAGATSNTVTVGGAPSNIGTIPQGYAAIVDPSNPSGYQMVAIPGGPEDMSGKAAVAASNAASASDVVTTAADRALAADNDRMVGGLPGYAASFNPSTPNAEVYRQVDVLRSNATIGNLQAMREASPTGGALGNVTEGEGKMLADKAGALDPASPYFQRDLMDYTRTLLRTIHGKEAGDAIFAEKYPEAATGQPEGNKNAGTTKSGLKWSVEP